MINGVRMRIIDVGLLMLLAFAGCKSQAEKQREAEAQKQAQEAEIDKRAQAIADKMADKIRADEATKRQDDEKKHQDEEDQRKKADETEKIRRAVQEGAMKSQLMANPAPFFQATNPQMFDKGIINSYRHLSSIELTNRSKYPVTNIRASLNFLDANGQLFATIPVQLAGSLAPGASSVFSEQQRTLTSGTVQMTAKPARTTFAVTHVEIMALAGDRP
jgi:hypothetical protein